jgi:ribose 5-phosphate isomerase B
MPGDISSITIGIGCDHWGFELKNKLIPYLQTRGIHLADFGAYSPQPVDYPDIAIDLAESIRNGYIMQGILICRTGLGMAIAANKVPGIFAAPVWTPPIAALARQSNNAQVITLGAGYLDFPTACEICLSWIQADFNSGASGPKVGKIYQIEQRYSHSVDAVR